MSTSDLQFAEVVTPPDLLPAELRWWQQAVRDALDPFHYELCDVCGKDADRHRVSPDMFGLPHIWCLDSPEDDQ